MGRTMEGSSSSSPLEAKRVIGWLIKLMLVLVFIGWLMIWIMAPTNTYRNTWTPKIRSDTNSTYFGRQGTNLLIYTFPILFIAAMGCVYLHLAQRSEKTDSTPFSRRVQAWRTPVLVKGPFGVLSGMELAFGIMFVALLVWCLWVYLTTSFARINPKSVHEDGEKLWEAKLDTVALRLGLIGNLCCAFLFFPVTRGSSLLPLVGLTPEGSIKYHVWLGHVVLALFTAHGLCYIIFWASTNSISQMIKWEYADISNVAGELALISGLIMWSTTFPRVRRKTFELFYYTHHLYVLFLLFFLLHVGINFFCMILPGVYLFMVDRYLRFLQSRRRVRLISARLLPSETIELNFAKSPGFNYTPTSTVFINVPSISSLQWHPFTVSSSSSLEPERLSIIIKKEGSWTQKLYTALSSPSLDGLDVSVEGPYGPASVNFQRYDSLVMVSGGSGITPFISVIRELIHRSTVHGVPTPSILLICAFKTAADLTMLDLVLPLSGHDISDLSNVDLKIEAFVTRDKSPTPNAQKLIRNLWLKARPSDLPFAPVLGSNSWMWLGGIVCSSFVAFLLIIGILTRYYIYPIDQNTNKIYSYSARALLNLLFMCACIAGAASVAVLWNKRRIAGDAKQVQIVDAVTPSTSPSSWFCNGGDRELESVPCETLVQATKVHYGGRPDLKKRLLECEGSNIGVMASGPSELRHQVATICSSGLVENMHFESISFNW